MLARNPGEAAELGAHALALLNTGRPGGAARTRSGTDPQGTPSETLTWLGERGLLAGVVSAGEVSPAEARIVHTEAERLRTDIGRALEAYGVGRRVPAPALYGINRVLEAGSSSRRLEAGPGGLELVEQEGGSGPLAVLAPLALSAARLMTTADPSRVRRCASAECGAWFVDTSKGGKRKWCSMARCGNRAKAATHRSRRSKV